MQQIGVKRGGGCLLKGGLFSGAYGMSRSYTFQYLPHKCLKLCPYLCEFQYTVYTRYRIAVLCGGNREYLRNITIGTEIMLGSILVPGAAEKYGLEVGDHAIAEQIVPCWECRYCKRGSYNMCELKGMSA